MNGESLQTLLDTTWVREVHYFETLPSTNAWAKASDRAIEVDSLVLTGRQTSGRGRGTHVWWSDSDCLTFSLVIAESQGHPWFLETAPVSLLTGIALCRTIQRVADSGNRPLRVQLKWPNDLMLNGRKAAGILVESCLVVSSREGLDESLVETGPRRRWIIGVGVNVNGSLNQAQAEVQAEATTLAQELGSSTSPERLLKSLIDELPRVFGEYAANPSVLEQWDGDYSILSGRRVEVEANGTRFSGIYRGVNETGAMRLENIRPNVGPAAREDGRETQRLVSSGSVLQWQDEPQES